MFFAANEGAHGQELWKVIDDGQTQGMSLDVSRFPATITAGVADGFTVTANVEALFGLIRDHHERFKNLGTQSRNIITILRSLAKVFTAVNDIHNKGSLAHPNELLEKDEAMLVINTAWTVLQYIDAKIR